MKKSGLIIFLLIVTILGFLFLNFNKNKNANLYTNSNIIKTSSFIQNDDRYVFYVSSESCSICEELKDDVNKEVNDFFVKNEIPFYLNDITSEIEKENFIKGPLYNATKTYADLPLNVTEYVQVKSTPTIIYVENNKIIYEGIGIQDDDSDKLGVKEVISLIKERIENE